MNSIYNLQVSPIDIVEISSDSWWMRQCLMYRNQWKSDIRSMVHKLEAKLFRYLLVVCIIGWIGYLAMGLVLPILLGLITLLLCAWWLYMTKQRKQLFQILNSIDRHNKLVNSIVVLDQLRDVGHSINILDRDSVIEALRLSKSNIFKALKTERILHDNPNFNPQEFAIEFASLQTISIGDEAGEYGKLFNEAFQISQELQSDLDEFIQTQSSKLIL